MNLLALLPTMAATGAAFGCCKMTHSSKIADQDNSRRLDPCRVRIPGSSPYKFMFFLASPVKQLPYRNKSG